MDNPELKYWVTFTASEDLYLGDYFSLRDGEACRAVVGQNVIGLCNHHIKAGEKFSINVRGK